MKQDKPPECRAAAAMAAAGTSTPLWLHRGMAPSDVSTFPCDQLSNAVMLVHSSAAQAGGGTE